MAGEPIAVNDDVELEIQPYRFGHRLAPRNPLSVNDDVVQRDCFALAGCVAREDARVVGERVDDRHRPNRGLDGHIPLADQLHTVPRRWYSNSSSTAIATRGP